MSAKTEKKRAKEKNPAKHEKRNDQEIKPSRPQRYSQPVKVKSCRTSSPCSIRVISLQQSTNKLLPVVVLIFSDLSHAWVVSFVSIKALVDLFSQSGVLFWSPWTQEMYSYKSANTPANRFHCTLLQGFHTCGNGLQGIP